MRAGVIAVVIAILCSCALDFGTHTKRHRKHRRSKAPAAARHHSYRAPSPTPTPALINREPASTDAPADELRRQLNLKIQNLNNQLQSDIQDQREIIAH